MGQLPARWPGPGRTPPDGFLSPPSQLSLSRLWPNLQSRENAGFHQPRQVLSSALRLSSDIRLLVLPLTYGRQTWQRRNQDLDRLTPPGAGLSCPVFLCDLPGRAFPAEAGSGQPVDEGKRDGASARARAGCVLRGESLCD